MEFKRAVEGVQLSNVLHQFFPPAPPTIKGQTLSTTVSTAATGPSTTPNITAQSYVPAGYRDVQSDGQSRSSDSNQEMMNAVVFVATGLFILFIADGFARAGGRRIRIDAIEKALWARM